MQRVIATGECGTGSPASRGQRGDALGHRVGRRAGGSSRGSLMSTTVRSGSSSAAAASSDRSSTSG